MRCVCVLFSQQSNAEEPAKHESKTMWKIKRYGPRPSVRAYVRRLDEPTPVRFVRERRHSKSEELRGGEGGGIVKRPL